jgi:hypothetical protein
MNTKKAGYTPTKTIKPLCVVCHEKPARIGKIHGYQKDLICSQKCAVSYFMNKAMDFTLCNVCGEWDEVCGGCDAGVIE